MCLATCLLRDAGGQCRKPYFFFFSCFCLLAGKDVLPRGSSPSLSGGWHPSGHSQEAAPAAGFNNLIPVAMLLAALEKLQVDSAFSHFPILASLFQFLVVISKPLWILGIFKICGPFPQERKRHTGFFPNRWLPTAGEKQGEPYPGELKQQD